jgi:hypothetical protein
MTQENPSPPARTNKEFQKSVKAMENSGDASPTLQLHPTLDFEICRKITQIESPKIQEFNHSDCLSRGAHCLSANVRAPSRVGDGALAIARSGKTF